MDVKTNNIDSGKTTALDVEKAKQLARVLAGVNAEEIKAHEQAKDEAEGNSDDATSSTEITQESDATEDVQVEQKPTAMAQSDLVVLATSYAEAKAEVATLTNANESLQTLLTTSEAKLVAANKDSDLLRQAAQHTCAIYQAQLGKGTSTLTSLTSTELATTFATLRNEFFETYPEGRSSQAPTSSGETSKVSASSTATIHPISKPHNVQD